MSHHNGPSNAGCGLGTRSFNHTKHRPIKSTGSSLAYTQDASTGRLIVVAARDRQRQRQSEGKRKREGGRGSHPSALCESFGLAQKA